MASRMSNQDRIQRMALEAEAAETEKVEQAKVKAKAKSEAKRKAAPRKKTAARKPTPRKKSGAKGRVKIVWTVGVPAGKALSVFPYNEKAGAQAEAEKLTSKKGTLHVVRSERQPMEADE